LKKRSEKVLEKYKIIIV